MRNWFAALKVLLSLTIVALVTSSLLFAPPPGGECPGDCSGPCPGDSDGDGRKNNADNCPQDCNPGQQNCNGDSEGDACESGPAEGDGDGDGICNGVDSCPTIPDSHVDADSDAVDDVCDNCLNASNPGQADLDGDRLGDACDLLVDCGLPDDSFEHLPPYYTGSQRMPIPALGQTIHDPVFGCPMRRVSDGPASPPGVASAAGNHYSSVDPFNRNGTRILMSEDKPVNVFVTDLQGNITNTNLGVFTWNEPRWSSESPDRFYYHSTPAADPNTPSNKIYAFDISPPSGSTELTAIADYGYISFGTSDKGTPNGEADIAPDQDLIVIGGKPPGSTQSHKYTRFRLFDLSRCLTTGICMPGPEISGGSSVALDPDPNEGAGADWCDVTPIHHDILCRIDRNTCPDPNATTCPCADPNDMQCKFGRIELYDGDTGAYLARIANFSAHSDRGIDFDTNGDSQPEEVLVMITEAPPDTNGGCPGGGWGIEKIRIPDGQRTCLLDNLSTAAVHISANTELNAAGSGPLHPWVLVSTYTTGGEQNFALPDGWDDSWDPYDNELLLIKIDGSQIRRLAHHRHRQDPPGETPTNDPNNDCIDSRCSAAPNCTPTPTQSCCGVRTDRQHFGMSVAAINRDGRYILFNSSFAEQPFLQDFPCRIYNDAFLIETTGLCNFDGTCDVGEECHTCPGDCIGSPECGNGICEAGVGEGCVACSDDCNDQAPGVCCGPETGQDLLCSEMPECNGSGFACSDSLSQSFCCGNGVCEAPDETGLNCAVLGAEVVSPNGGETLTINNFRTLEWTTTAECGSVSSVDVLLSRTGPNGPFEILFNDITDTGSQSWQVTAPATTNAFLKVVASHPGGTAADQSGASFTIEWHCGPCPEGYCQDKGIRCTFDGTCGPGECCNYSCNVNESCTAPDSIPDEACGGP